MVRFAYTVPSTDPLCGILLGFLLYGRFNNVYEEIYLIVVVLISEHPRVWVLVVNEARMNRASWETRVLGPAKLLVISLHPSLDGQIYPVSVLDTFVSIWLLFKGHNIWSSLWSTYSLAKIIGVFFSLYYFQFVLSSRLASACIHFKVVQL